MKKLGLLISIIFVWSAQALAVDTSGCSQTRAQQKSVQTLQGRQLKLVSYKAPRANCANANESVVTVEMQWSEASRPAQTDTQFWVRVNGTERKLSAQTRCTLTEGLAGRSGEVTCVAQTSFTAKGVGSLEIEVAPEVNGAWDTGGPGRNYNFSL